MIDIPANDPAHVTIRMPSPQGTASPTPASTPRTAADNQQERLVSGNLSSCDVTCPDCINLPAQHGHKDAFCDTAADECISCSTPQSQCLSMLHRTPQNLLVVASQ